MSDTPNYDYLKPVLGEELFGQFAEKMAAAQGIQLANVGDGAYIPKAKYDADKRQLSSQITPSFNRRRRPGRTRPRLISRSRS